MASDEASEDLGVIATLLGRVLCKALRDHQAAHHGCCYLPMGPCPEAERLFELLPDEYKVVTG